MSEHDQWLDDDSEQEIEIEAIGIEVSEQPIELYKLFKIANLVGGGGEAKHIIAEGYVAVNGDIETRKRRKMYDGDLVEFNQEYYVVICDAPVTEPKETLPLAVSEPATKKQSQAQKKSAKRHTGANRRGQEGKSSKSKQGGKTGAQSSVKKAPQTEKTAARDSQSGRRSITFF
ncbi:RNA-binding S4 domain-containing protein [Vibrio sp. SM6]|uniref:RNA-binding S4 domain-containing protein n=1 Tax=Vibrio agarilyticus TaxID=2726741 RepID=A0A7X8TRI8_9VIBR|nr:RNA-binding S4 domain-containing protein [Vibrio agarilyticus]NLS13306.1 RNA-binding S4 domain-containing protein [Vibrio agarilyticus]